MNMLDHPAPPLSSVDLTQAKKSNVLKRAINGHFKVHFSFCDASFFEHLCSTPDNFEVENSWCLHKVVDDELPIGVDADKYFMSARSNARNTLIAMDEQFLYIIFMMPCSPKLIERMKRV